jgi:hypothetical protein
LPLTTCIAMAPRATQPLGVLGGLIWRQDESIILACNRSRCGCTARMGHYRLREESDYVTFVYIVHRTAHRVEGCLFDVEARRQASLGGALVALRPHILFYVQMIPDNRRYHKHALFVRQNRIGEPIDETCRQLPQRMSATQWT